MLNEKQRGGIISARKLGLSYRAIANTIGCHQKTVGRVLALESNSEKPPIGRPPLIDSEGCERLKTLVTDGKRQFTAKALCTAFEEQEGKSVCVKTIRRTLHKVSPPLPDCIAQTIHQGSQPGQAACVVSGTTGLEAEGLEEGFFHR